MQMTSKKIRKFLVVMSLLLTLVGTVTPSVSALVQTNPKVEVSSNKSEQTSTLSTKETTKAEGKSKVEITNPKADNVDLNQVQRSNAGPQNQNEFGLTEEQFQTLLQSQHKVDWTIVEEGLKKAANYDNWSKSDKEKLTNDTMDNTDANYSHSMAESILKAIHTKRYLKDTKQSKLGVKKLSAGIKIEGASASIFSGLATFFDGITADAASLGTGTLYVIFPTSMGFDGQTSGYYSSDSWNVKDGQLSNFFEPFLFAKVSGEYYPSFCIEPSSANITLADGGYNAKSDANGLGSVSNAESDIYANWAYWGFFQNWSSKLDTDGNDKKFTDSQISKNMYLDYIYTQVVIWYMIKNGARNAFSDDSLTNIAQNWLLGSGFSASDFLSWAHTTQNQIANALKPTQVGDTQELKMGQSVTFTSSSFNGATVDQSTVPDGLNASISGTTLTVNATKNYKGDNGTIETISINQDLGADKNIYLTSSGYQDQMIPLSPQANTLFVKVKMITTGSAKFVKKDIDTGEVVPGTKFHVTFSDGTAAKDITTGSDGSFMIDNILDGTKVTATETFVPEPYYKGTDTTITGTIQAGTTITMTKTNKKQVGQISLVKTGLESGTTMWNSNYTLEGNTFRVVSSDGKTTKTITTDKDGNAKTSADLPLGTYTVTETQASNGFANTFSPVTVELKYAGQDVEVVYGNVKGTNQEVTGETTLTKEDSETGNETQGSATFTGAEYTLFHDDGTPVKWAENYHPELTEGTKADEENIVLIVDAKQQVGVKHLALGNYYWQETKAPVGYAIDTVKHNVSITYQDQNTPIIVKDVTSKENVIKFNFDGFKYVTSKSGSAQTGFNGITFSLTPMDGTKGDVQTETTGTDANGYDGYFQFKNIPYGTYKFEETEAPKGFEKITPLIIKSSKEDDNYIFTITEDGQTEPIKTVTIPVSSMQDDKNIVTLSKYFLFDDAVQPPTIGTTLTTDEGDKVINADGKVKLVDKVAFENLTPGDSYTLNGVLTSEGNEILVDGKKVTATTTFKPTSKNGTTDVTFEFDASKLDDKTLSKVTAFEELLDAKGQIIADHKNPDDDNQTVKIHYPKIGTTLTTDSGDKVIFANGKVKLVDTIQFENLTEGETYTANGTLTADGKEILVDGKEVKGSTTFTPEETTGTVKVTFEFDATKLDDKTLTKVTAFEEILNASGSLVADHKNPDDEKQTVKIYRPTIGTIATWGNGEKTINGGKIETAVDEVKYQNLPTGDYYVVTKALDKKTGKFIAITESVQTAEEENGIWSIKQDIDTSKLGEHDIVYYEYIYQDKEHSKFVAKHEDKNDKGQTISVKKVVKPVVPKPAPKTKEEATKPTKAPGTLPHLGEGKGILLMLLGIILVVFGTVVLKKKNSK
jgi:uncharacterized surface anchored protein